MCISYIIFNIKIVSLAYNVGPSLNGEQNPPQYTIVGFSLQYYNLVHVTSSFNVKIVSLSCKHGHLPMLKCVCTWQDIPTSNVNPLHLRHGAQRLQTLFAIPVTSTHLPSAFLMQILFYLINSQSDWILDKDLNIFTLSGQKRKPILPLIICGSRLKLATTSTPGA